jgi:hypothetical protein
MTVAERKPFGTESDEALGQKLGQLERVVPKRRQAFGIKLQAPKSVPGSLGRKNYHWLAIPGLKLVLKRNAARRIFFWHAKSQEPEYRSQIWQ